MGFVYLFLLVNMILGFVCCACLGALTCCDVGCFSCCLSIDLL